MLSNKNLNGALMISGARGISKILLLITLASQKKPLRIIIVPSAARLEGYIKILCEVLSFESSNGVSAAILLGALT